MLFNELTSIVRALRLRRWKMAEEWGQKNKALILEGRLALGPGGSLFCSLRGYQASARLPNMLSTGDKTFHASLLLLGGSYVLLVLLLLAADVAFCSAEHLRTLFYKPEIQFAAWLTLKTCTLAAFLSVLVGIPLGYILSRWRFRFRWLVDAIVDIPVVLPPLVVGISLLILFNQPALFGTRLEDWFRKEWNVQVTYGEVAVVVAQFAVAAAFAVRTMRVTFDQITPRTEQVALTLGCSQMQAFMKVTVPEAWRGIVTAFTLAWARSLGEFGPIMVFAGATRMKTEVLSTTVFLELSVGSLESAVGVSLLMVAVAVIVLLLLRWLGLERRAA
jgi:molybdate transport system permease protein